MGRIYTAPTINKSVINNTITSTLSAVYTNATGAGAELRAVNINGLQNNATINTTASGASEWTHFGSNVNPIISYSGVSSYLWGEPYQVQLSANRVLLFFLPHSHHRGGSQDFFGGTMVHTQILEYQTNKYVAGPIQCHTLPSAWFSDFSYNLWSKPDSSSTSYTHANWKAVALTATKIAVVCQQRSSRWLMRFTITGNTVDHAVTSLDIGGASYFNTTTCGPFALENVPDNTDKVIVGGNGVTNWRAMAFNMPNTGALSAAGSLLDLGIAQSTLYNFGMSKMVKTATSNITPYLFAVTTGATTSQSVAFNFNSSTNAWTTASSAITLTAVSTAHTGLECACLSTGTGVNAVIAATTGTGASDGLVTFYRQTSSTTLSTTRTSITTQNTSVRSLAEHYQWGDERVVFVGENGTLVCFDSAGVATNLISALTESVNTVRYMTKWYPFNSRPLYVYYDPSTINSNATGNYKARVNSTGSATSVGQTSHTETYLPWGYDYGEGYAWNELAGCWMVCQGGRIYAISTTGVVLSELNITLLSPSLAYNHCAAQIQVTPTGRLLIGFEQGIKVVPSTTYVPNIQAGNYGNSMLTIVTEPMTSSTQLPTLKAQQVPVSMSGSSMCNMVYFSEQTSSLVTTEMAYLLYMGTSGTQFRIGFFNGTTWSDLGNTGQGATDGTWTIGYRMNLKLIQDTPCSTTIPRGLWRLVGSYAFNNAAQYYCHGISGAYSIQNNISSLTSSSYPLNGKTGTESYASQGWGTPMHIHFGSKSGTQVATIFDEYLGMTRVYTSINGRLNNSQGYSTPWYPVQVLSTTVTSNLITVLSTAGMYANMAVRFNGTAFGNITAGTTYYVLAGFTSTTFTVSTSVGGSALTLSSATGSTMTVSYYMSNRWAQIAASKMGYSVALQNTAQIDQQGFNYTFNTVDSTTFQSTQVATIGSGWFVLYRTGKNTWQSYNSTASINTTYSAYGLPDDVKFYLTLDDNAGNVFYLNNGQTLSPSDTVTGLFRSETIYQIPNGYSIKASCDTPNVVALLLTIKEMQ